MFNYFFAFVWGLLILLSFAGWGFLLNKILKGNFPKDFGFLAALGLALNVTFGAFLNWFGKISKISLEILFAVGIIAGLVLLFGCFKNLKSTIGKSLGYLNEHKVFAGFVGLAILTGLFFYGLSVSPGNFNPHDDYQAYFVYSEKMLQTGHMGNDPFSERRIITSFGGQNFLDTYILLALKDQNLALLDKGVGFLILIFLALALFRDFKLKPEAQLFLLFMVLFAPVPIVNITSTFTGLVLFLALFRLAYYFKEANSQWWSRALVFAVLSAGLAGLKNNFLPALAVIFAGCYFVFWKNEGRKKSVIWEFLFSSFLVLIFLAPWMCSMYQSSGTFLYPLLGKGFYGSADQASPAPNGELFSLNGLARTFFNVREIMFAAVFVLAWVYFRYAKNTDKLERALAAVLVWASAVGLLAVIWGTGAADVYRYVYVFLLTTFLVLLVLYFSSHNQAISLGKTSITLGLVGFGITAIYLGNALGKFLEKDNMFSLAVQAKSSLAGSNLISKDDLAQLTAMQNSVPKGELILARLKENFVFDFKRNPVYIADAPGGSSLPPGMPMYQGGEALAGYLVSKNIRYVAYAYKDEANFSHKEFDSQLSPSIQLWARTEARHYFGFQDNLAELGQSRKRIYDDGSNFVLDLSQKAQ